MVTHMKWWGWGKESVSFSPSDKPDLAPFIRTHIGLDITRLPAQPPAFADLTIADPVLPEPLRAALVDAAGAEHVTTDAQARVVHAYGKSLRDLVRVRNHDLGRLPDVVVYPGDEEAVRAVLAAALAADAVVIPFGGGTNISGSLEAPRTETRPVISVDLGRLDRVLEIDADARLARVQAGALGPGLEEQLAAQGWTLGHFPDSFAHSTLGGWIATRSSGMQSDKYGDIAEITRAVRVVTPAGVLVTRPVPSQSTGPSVREMILGSEGRLGIITEATVQVHRVPEQRVILGYFFPTWDAALLAMREIAASEAAPTVTRVSDANETRFSFATRKRGSLASSLVSAGMKQYLRRVRRYDLDQMCLSFIGFEGSPAHVKAQRKLVGAIVARRGGICVGTGPGQLYDQKKFDTPYIRDFLLGQGAMADVSETSTSWSQLGPLYRGVVARANKAFAEIGVTGWIMCHLSHSYHSGACLYFTFAYASPVTLEAIDGYDTVKSAIQQGFIEHAGTLSHHHAVGVEHARWLADDISPAGVRLLTALFDGIDPGRNLNPGKIVPGVDVAPGLADSAGPDSAGPDSAGPDSVSPAGSDPR
ncbi:FAD-binding oxidoreductase [Frankia sp. CeD]|uniref:FAD-binding oxidoreductase n=1 Tax=Frankia sp. CeD TaxID=258230 RepID=UPI0004DCE166|nr:FAD-binding oxidoreductase [Frankia sp. CeD]KEZ36444.1 FAD/FMN-dependent dehydrogenase [Frankia sp. CeD]